VRWRVLGRFAVCPLPRRVVGGGSVGGCDDKETGRSCEFCPPVLEPWPRAVTTPPMSTTDPPGRNHYELLRVPRTASPTEIKASYRRLLLSRHPDKSDTSKGGSTPTESDIGLLKEAFVTLFSPESRVKYDSELSSRPDPTLPTGRPADIVSLEDFEDLGRVWAYNCRCGGWYTIEEKDMEKGVHLIACPSCSEVIWAGYEASPSEDDDITPGGS